MAPTGARLLGWVRLTHPFPSVLDGLVSAVVATLAGGPADAAARIGLAMTLLQLGIGATNDIVDAPRDAGHKAGKPIPDGLVPVAGARALAAACFSAGLILSVSISAAIGLLAVVVSGVGLAYDLRLKGTAWSWLPFAVGIPILPVFGWLAATGSLTSLFAVLIPAAIAAGAALAIGNALVDLERDRAAGVSSIAVALGATRASSVAVGLFAFVWALALAAALAAAAAPILVAAIGVVGLVPPAAAARARSERPAGRERLWQLEAVSLAVLIAIWLVAVIGTPGFAR